VTFSAFTVDLDAELTPPELDLTTGSELDCVPALSQAVSGVWDKDT